MKTVIACIVGIGMTVSPVFAQGSLTPPGAPAPTMKTLDQLGSTLVGVSNRVEQLEARVDALTLSGDGVREIIISEPGSYYLSGNLEVGKSHGIYINATNVTVDLNGFLITRSSGSGGTGIYIEGAMDNTTIRNGSIDGGSLGFQYGIRCLSGPSYAESCLMEKLAVSQCSGTAIVAGKFARLIDCRVFDNTGNGINAREGSRLTDCIAHDNQGWGIFAFISSSLEGCIAYNNQGSYGIGAYSGSTLIGCTAYNNESDHAIYAYVGSSLTGCSAYDNQGTYAIYAREGSSLSGCTAGFNKCDYGIYAAEASNLSGCTARLNTGSGSQSAGIYVGAGSAVIDCVVKSNSHTNSPGSNVNGMGIDAGAGSLIKGCVVGANEGDGIRISVDSTVIGNTCDSNGSGGDGAGIHATSSDNRIEANDVTDNDRGIDVDNTGNFIACNTVSGNTTNWTVAAQNACLVIYRIQGGAITGDSGGTSPGSTDPWANFTY